MNRIKSIKSDTFKILYFTALLMMLSFSHEAFAQEQRFPKPEFYTPYSIPEATTPEPRATGMENFDLFLLILVLGFTSWLIFKKRSRSWIIGVSVFSLAYFGFYRNGCICSIGAIQNFALSLFGADYTISFTVLAIFVIPLLLALVAGRIFCASACPLGVIQDLVIVKPIKINPVLRKILGIFPFIYLGLAVLYAATGTDFIICRYDPFVGIFRMGAEFHLIVLGIAFLLLGMFVARPFCRFICPYGAMLKICSINTKYHLSITPKDCINCKLCKDSCPFEAIEFPTESPEIKSPKKNNRKFLVYAALIPLMMFVGSMALSSAHIYLSKANPDVRLAHTLLAHPELIHSSNDLDVQTFMASGKTLDVLVAEALQIQQQFYTGSRILGAFLGLVLALSLLSQLIYRRRDIYEPDRGNCFSCGRCMKYCPVGKPEHPYFIENPDKLKEMQEQKKP